MKYITTSLCAAVISLLCAGMTLAEPMPRGVALIRGEAILARLRAALPPAQLRFSPRLIVVEGSPPNAFFVAPSTVLVSRTLIDSSSDDQLAFIVAHELAHGLLTDRPKSLTTMVFGLRGGLEHQTALERRADKIAFTLMDSSGFLPRAAINLLRRLEIMRLSTRSQAGYLSPTLTPRRRALTRLLRSSRHRPEQKKSRCAA